MKKKMFMTVVVSCLLGTISSSVMADLTVTYVGDNPYSSAPNTGGSGNIAGQGNGSATVEKTFTTLGLIPIVLQSNPSSGSDTIHINERVRNNTGTAWTDFHFALVSIDANPLLQVEFLNVTNPTGEWTSIQSGTNSLSLFGLVADGGIFSLSFDLKATSSQGSFDLFAIQEFPTVPSPSASVLALLGCSILAVISRPRGRQVSA